MTPFRTPHARSKPGVRQANSGFTMIELMIVVVIVAILIALAAPSFTPLIERWRVRDSAETLTSTLFYARSEAIKRGGRVIMTKSADSTDCTTGGVDTKWDCGWHIFFDANDDGSQGTCVATDTPNECDLQVTPSPSRVEINLPSSTGSITIDRWGMLSHTPVGGGSAAPTSMSFELKPKGKNLSDSSAAKLCTSTGGRIVRIKGSDTCP